MTDTTLHPDGRIGRDDLEASFRAIKDEIDGAATDTRDKAVPFAIIGVLLVLFLAYRLGKRAGKTESTVVEIRRI